MRTISQLIRKVFVFLLSLLLGITCMYTVAAEEQDESSGDVSVHEEQTMEADEDTWIYSDQTETDLVEVTAESGIAEDIYTYGNSTIYLHPGESQQLYYRLSPSDAEETPVWSVDKNFSEYAKVDQNGLVTALKAGETYVRATISNGDSATYRILVADYIESISFDSEELTVITGGWSTDIKYRLEIWPATASLSKLTYSSADPSVVYFNDPEQSSMSVAGEGTTTVTVDDGYGHTASVVVRVIDGYATGINAVKSTVYMHKGDSTKLEYNLSGKNNPAKEMISWKVLCGEDIVTVSDEGVVTAKGYGMAQIQARTALYDKGIATGNYYCMFTVYVADDPVGLHFTKDEYNINSSYGGILYAVSDTPEAEYCERTYTSSDESILHIDNDGYYYVSGEGTVTVTCKAANDVEAKAVVNVGQPWKRKYLYLEGLDSVNLSPGEQFDLKANLKSYSEFEISEFEFSTVDPSVAVVENGIITAVNYGSTFVKILDIASGKYTRMIPINVHQDLTGFDFIADDFYLKTGKNQNLRMLMHSEPASVQYMDITFASSDESVASITNEGTYWGVFGKKAGTAVITAEKSTGEKAFITVHVGDSKKAESISYGETEPFTVHTNYIRRPKLTIMPFEADQTSYRLTSADPSIAGIEIPREPDENAWSIKGVGPGKTTVTATLISDPSQSVSFEVTVLDGDVNTYPCINSLYHMDECYDMIGILPSKDEYTCYVGEIYELYSSVNWTAEKYIEIPTQRTTGFDILFSAENNCISKLYMGYGWSGTPTSFNDAFVTVPFICNREGTAVIRTVGNRTVTIHVVNPPKDELEELAEEISNADDPTETVTFEESSEEVKEKIEAAINNGESLSVDLEEKTIENINEEDKALIVETINANEETVIDCYDVSLLLKTSGSEEVIGTIVETSKPITVRLPLSEAAKTNGENFKVVRIHGNTAEELPCELSEDGNCIIFQTDKFSTYAVVYDHKKPSIEIYGSSLNLEGKIGINFFLDIPDELANESTVHMTMGSQTITAEAAEGTERVIDGHKYLMFTCPVAAKEMRDIVTLTVEDKSGKKVKLTKEETDYTNGYDYSASDYFAKAETAGQEKTKKLTRVLNNYGKYAQIYFEYSITDEVNDTADVSSVTLTTLEPYKAVMTSEEVAGLTYAGGSAMLDDAVGYRLYFNLETGHQISEYTFTIDGKKVTPVLRSGSQYYIEKANIAAKDLGIMNEIKVTNGTAAKTIRYSALSYAYRALELTAEEKIPLQNMCRAMYLYNQQAIEYFNN